MTARRTPLPEIQTIDGQALPASTGSAAYFRSCAEWPSGLIHNAYRNDMTEDRHDTEGQAKAVCGLLWKHGLGGEGCHFPLRIWVERIQPQNDKLTD